MRWLAEQDGPIDRFNQSMLLQCGGSAGGSPGRGLAEPARSSRCAAAGLDAGAQWSLEVAPPGAVPAGRLPASVDVRGLDDAARGACISEQAQAAASRLAPAPGDAAGVWFDAATRRRPAAC